MINAVDKLIIALFFYFLLGPNVLFSADHDKDKGRGAIVLCKDCYPRASWLVDGMSLKIERKSSQINHLRATSQRLVAEKKLLEGRFADGVIIGIGVGALLALYFTGGSGS